MKPLKDIKYIDNDIQKGIEYDWKLILKEYKKLGIPKDVYNPSHIPFENSNIFVIMSERSTGKTTNLLLVGCVMSRLYNSKIAYFVDSSAHAQPKKIREIFNTIIECGYVEKITDGEYNSIFVYGGKARWCNVDETGKVIDKCENQFMDILVVSEHENYKSVWTSTKSDLIIFDEFIKDWYPKDLFIHTMDLLSTVKRDRICSKFFMLSNLVDKNSQMFDELEIREYVNKMDIGDNKVITTELGTPIYVEIVGSHVKAQTPLRKLSNKLYYGFKNPAMVSITGGGWSVNSYPHIPSDCGNITYIDKGLRVRLNEELLQLELCYSDTIGYMVLVHRCTTIYDDSRIYTLKAPLTHNEVYGFGHTKYDKMIWSLYNQNRFYYSTNGVGATLNSYIRNVKQR